MKIALSLVLASMVSCSAQTTRFETNILSGRLADSTYTSPNSSFELRVPPLLLPGAKVMEHILDDSTHVVSMFDDFGRAYYVMQIQNQAGLTLDSISSNFTANPFLLDTQYVNSDYGTELRIVGVKKGAGLAGTHTVGSNTEAFVEDMLETKAIFLRANYIYDFTASQSVGDSTKYGAVIVGLKEQLNDFLRGLKLH